MPWKRSIEKRARAMTLLEEDDSNVLAALASFRRACCVVAGSPYGRRLVQSEVGELGII